MIINSTLTRDAFPQPFPAGTEPKVHSAYRQGAEGTEYTLNFEIDGKHFNVDVEKAPCPLFTAIMHGETSIRWP